jgi:type IV pilus assembly protein PilV
MLKKTAAASRCIARRRDIRGFSMLETLVALLVIAIWLLGSAGVQTVALKLNKASAMRNQAVLLAAEVGERMENNRAAASVGAYVFGGTQPASGADCVGAPCAPDKLAIFDLAEIYKRQTETGSKVTITKLSEDAKIITYSIVVSWSDRRTGQTYSDAGTDEVGRYTTTKAIYKA